jgi:hypothetical protein
MDIALRVFASAGDPDLRAHLYREYEWGIERERKRKLLQADIERILKKLLEVDVQLPQGYNLTMADLGLGDVTEDINGTLRVMQRRRHLIQFLNNTMTLTQKGRKMAKKIK